MKTTKFKLQFAVTTHLYLGLLVLDTYKDLKWFDTEDEAIFDFAKTHSSWEELPNNMVIKRVVKI